MHKVSYISEYDIGSHADGVAAKIALQMHAFAKRGLLTEHVRCPDAFASKTWGKILSQLPFFPAFQDYRTMEIPKADFLYVRKPIVADRYFVAFLKKARRAGIKKIVLELPVYPYDGQILHTWYKAPILLKDICNRKKLRKYVDLIATYTFDTQIFGISAAHIENALDFSAISERIPSQKENRIDLLAVSSMAYWHGYDRIIRGLKEYYSRTQSVPVYLHLVGDGPAAAEYKKLITQLDLWNYVFYYGLKSGNELDDIYNMCDIGICTLACHRKKMYLTSELKSREYAAKSLPMVGSCGISCYLENECDFFCKVTADETAVDIGSIVSWYQTLLIRYGGVKKLSDFIREYGNRHCDIYQCMTPVTNFFWEQRGG